MAAFLGVAGATGRAARPGSRSPARPLRADAVASPATAPWVLGGRPRRGARRRGGEQGRAPWQPTIKLLESVGKGAVFKTSRLRNHEEENEPEVGLDGYGHLMTELIE
mgnify:CR=1 FL=1